MLFTGNSMGGFGALAFAPLSPGADILAYSPQSTLDKAKVPWEPRYEKAWSANWTLPFSDAADGIESAGRVNIIYDPYVSEDRAHVERITGPNVQKLQAWYGSHKTPVFLRRLDILKPISEAALSGALSSKLFYDLYRARRGTPWYRNSLANHAKRRGHEALAARVEAAADRMRPEEQAAQQTEIDRLAAAERAQSNAARDGAAAKGGPFVVERPAADVAQKTVGLIGLTHAGDPYLDRWLAYHGKFLPRNQITLLYSGAAPVDTGCNLLPAGDAPWAFATLLANHITQSMGATAVLRSSEFLVLDPDFGENPFVHAVADDARSVITPFGIEILHNRHAEKDAILPTDAILDQRPTFRPNTECMRPALLKQAIRFSNNGRQSDHPHLNLSERLFMFDVAAADHDLGCMNAATDPQSRFESPAALSEFLDKTSQKPAEERDPCIYWAHQRTYRSWVERRQSGAETPGFEPFALKKRLFSLPARFRGIF